MYGLFVAPDNLVKPFAGIIYADLLMIDIFSVISFFSLFHKNHIAEYFIVLNYMPKFF